jgi:hypothetical protein
VIIFAIDDSNVLSIICCLLSAGSNVTVSLQLHDGYNNSLPGGSDQLQLRMCFQSVANSNTTICSELIAASGSTTQLHLPNSTDIYNVFGSFVQSEGQLLGCGAHCNSVNVTSTALNPNKSSVIVQRAAVSGKSFQLRFAVPDTNGYYSRLPVATSQYRFSAVLTDSLADSTAKITTSTSCSSSVGVCTVTASTKQASSYYLNSGLLQSSGSVVFSPNPVQMVVYPNSAAVGVTASSLNVTLNWIPSIPPIVPVLVKLVETATTNVILPGQPLRNGSVYAIVVRD